MADYRTIPAAELGKGSNIKVEWTFIGKWRSRFWS